MTFMSLSQRVELEQGKKSPAEVREMNLDHSKSTCIEGLNDEFVNLEVLSLVGVGLESLAGLPKLPALRILELTNNSISGGLDTLVNCPKLEQLNLTSNKIAAVESLTSLAKLSNLRSLDLFNCEIANLENYRKKVFAALPNLKYLDGLDENNESEPGFVGLPNGDGDNANGTSDAEDDDDENDSEDDEEEEYGLEALQRSEELEDDDEEDYAPGEDEEAEYENDLDDEDDDDDEIVDDGANLSGAGVTGPRRPSSKRRCETAAVDEAEPATKHKAAEADGDESQDQ